MRVRFWKAQEKRIAKTLEPLRPSCEPLSKPQEEFIATIVATLDVDAKRRNECLDTVRFRLRSARSLQRFYSKVLPPGAQKRKAASLSSALKKARSLSQEIEPLFSAMLNDRTMGNDVDMPFLNGRVIHLPPAATGYDDYRHFLDQAIAVADELKTTIRIPKGQKPRDVNKWQAKAIATDIVAAFSPLAGERATPRGKPTTTTIGESGARGERGTIDEVASLIYQILTGHEGVELTEDLDAYEPPTIRTRPTMKK